MKIIILIIWLLVFQNSKCYIFSVIISIYNTGRYLDESIGSLLNQTIGFKNIQIILVNDGSTDISENICLKYKEKYDKNIIYINKSHSGVSDARNLGLRYVKGLYINFLDSDDKWDSKAFKYVYLFFKLNKNINLVGGRMKYFESKKSFHFLDYKFQYTRIVNLNKDYNCIQLSSSSSFFRFSSIRRIKFEHGIFSGEDVKFISNLLLFNPILGLVKEAIYYYRKRSDSSSTMQNNENKKEFYFNIINLVQQNLIKKSILLYNKILPFIQFYIAYETLFRIESLSYKYLDNKSYNEYCSVIQNILIQIEDKYILEQKIFPSRLKIFALSKKYNRDIRYDIILSKNQFLYSNYILINLNSYYNGIIWLTLDIKDNIFHLEGEDRLWLPREKYYYFCKLENKIFFPKYYLYSGFDFATLYGNINKGRIISFDIVLDIKSKGNLKFYLSYMGNIIEIITSFSIKSHLSQLKNSYYIKDNYILKNNRNILCIYKYDYKLVKFFELKYSIELKYIQKDYLISIRQKNIKYREKSKNTMHKQIWLINDKKAQAGDNGEFFFRYLKKIKTKEISFYFVIEKNCFDYERLKHFGKIIDLNSSRYLKMFLNADKIITSVYENWVNNAFGNDIKYMIDLYHFDFIYLQSGIVKDDLSFYLNKIKTNFDLIITSSKKEYQSFLDMNYGYSKNNLALTGLPRFDNLIGINNKIKKKKIILIFPTWRIYIKGTRDLVTLKSIESKNFINTTYFNFYNNLINNQKLLDIMEKHDYKGIFCLHPNFESQYKYFNENKLFKIKQRCNNQKLFAKISLLVTDYSSIFFDFGYIKKPVVFTQFDYEEYRYSQFPKGYFDYGKDGFGKICYDLQCSIESIKSMIEKNCIIQKLYIKRIRKFFRYHDDNNCFRVYKEIMNINKKDKSERYFIEHSFSNVFIILVFKFVLKYEKLIYIKANNT